MLQGTEAAAVTKVEMRNGCSLSEEEPFEMVVDRPFLFFIVEKSQQVILFAGKIAAPVSS